MKELGIAKKALKISALPSIKTKRGVAMGFLVWGCNL